MNFFPLFCSLEKSIFLQSLQKHMSRTWSGGDFYRNQTIHFVLCFQAYFTKYNKKWICFKTKKIE